MKRFTETNKWRDPWFRKLSCPAKNLWQYLLDNCDNAGVIDLDIEAASFCIGIEITESHLQELETRIERMPNGKLWVKKFVAFQFGELKPTSMVHKSVLKLLQSHSIDISHTNGMPMGSPSYKEKEKEKEGGVGGTKKSATRPSLEEMKAHGQKIGLPDSEVERCFDHYESNGWKVGKNPMRSWRSAMSNWKRNWEDKTYGNTHQTNLKLGRNGPQGTAPDYSSGQF